MCTLVMFRDDYVGSPCKLFEGAKHIPNSDSSALPWLYYGEGDAHTVLFRKKITAKYSMDPSSKVSRKLKEKENKVMRRRILNNSKLQDLLLWLLAQRVLREITYVY